MSVCIPARIFLYFAIAISCNAFAASTNANKSEVVNNAATPSLQFQSAQQCRECHQDIYQEWSQSWMSRALTNPVFQQDFSQWQKYAASLGEDPASCLRCHAPVAVLTGDMQFNKPASREGVTCTVCHKTALVRERDDRHFLVMDPRNVLYGAGEDQSTDAHVIKHSEALTDSSLCAGCHLDMSNGIPLEYTYHEWQQSAYAENNTQCMDCHMPVVQDTDSTGTHRSHRFQGGHSSSELLKGAASIALKSTPAKNQLAVTVTNVRVGHSFPTGGAHPARLVLNVVVGAADGSELHRAEKVYEFEYLNKSGKKAEGREQAVSVSDTTLKALQSREELFDIPVLEQAAAVKATLVYELIPASRIKTLPEVYQAHYQPVVIDEAKISYRELMSK